MWHFFILNYLNIVMETYPGHLFGQHHSPGSYLQTRELVFHFETQVANQMLASSCLQPVPRVGLRQWVILPCGGTACQPAVPKETSNQVHWTDQKTDNIHLTPFKMNKTPCKILLICYCYHTLSAIHQWPWKETSDAWKHSRKLGLL